MASGVRFTGDYACECDGFEWQPGVVYDDRPKPNNPMFEEVVDQARKPADVQAPPTPAEPKEG